MATYVPILKGKPGEFKAWRNAERTVRDNARVLFEVVPSGDPLRDLTLFAQRQTNSFHQGDNVAVDSGALGQDTAVDGTGARPILWLARALQASSVPIKPVIHLDDSDNVLRDVRAAVALHGQGACLRLGSSEADPDPNAAAASMPNIQHKTGLTLDTLDLVIDLWEVDSARDATRAAQVASAVLTWAGRTSRSPRSLWRSVTVAAGAFPVSISNLPTGQATPVHRYDADLYDTVIAAGPAILPDYGDYGIGHPSMPLGGRSPLPSLRYTSDRDWQVYRETKTLPGHDSFFTLCEKVVRSRHWPASGRAYSWGDSEIARCAASIGRGGTATEWRAFGTSHHMAHVIDRLATLSVP
jgi:hypothetical protein